jgi:putative addiction module killer protein
MARLRDDRAKQRINIRIRRLQLGNPGDVKAIGGGVSEMRIDYGPGYRVYLIQSEPAAVILLCGGDKSSQAGDIERARSIAAELEL